VTQLLDLSELLGERLDIKLLKLVLASIPRELISLKLHLGCILLKLETVEHALRSDTLCKRSELLQKLTNSWIVSVQLEELVVAL